MNLPESAVWLMSGMNREQKRAWALVSSMLVAAILCVAALVSRHFAFRLATILPFGAAAVVQGTGALVRLRVKPDKGPVTFDERDKLIRKNAGMAGLGAVFLFIILASFAPIAVLGEEASIPVNWLPFLLAGPGLCFPFVYFAAILVRYGRAENGEEP